MKIGRRNKIATDKIDIAAGIAFLTLWGISILASLAVPIAIIWIAVHFIRKFW